MDTNEKSGYSWVGKLQLVHPYEIPSIVKDVQEKLQNSIVRHWRQTITGDPNRRIRDNMGDDRVQTKVKQVDAISFAMGVVLTMSIEYIVLVKPQFFPVLFYFLMAFLMVYRFFSYKSSKEHFFMIDFCYFVQLSTWIQTLSCIDAQNEDMCQLWFKNNFLLSHGPIAVAIVAWQNSLVFHSIDKVTSFAIHIMPGVFHYLLRWDSRMWSESATFTPLTWSEQFFYPLCFYLAWQLIYFYIQFTVIEKDRSLVTSLRYLAGDHNNPSTKLGYKMAVYFGFIEQGESLNPYDFKIILMFASFQLVYVILSLIPTRLMYNYELINAFYLVILTFCAIWNGGSYYIQIFSQRYNSKFEKKAE